MTYRSGETSQGKNGTAGAGSRRLFSLDSLLIAGPLASSLAICGALACVHPTTHIPLTPASSYVPRMTARCAEHPERMHSEPVHQHVPLGSLPRCSGEISLGDEPAAGQGLSGILSSLSRLEFSHGTGIFVPVAMAATSQYQALPPACSRYRLIPSPAS